MRSKGIVRGLVCGYGDSVFFFRVRFSLFVDIVVRISVVLEVYGFRRIFLRLKYFIERGCDRFRFGYSLFSG